MMNFLYLNTTSTHPKNKYLFSADLTHQFSAIRFVCNIVPNDTLHLPLAPETTSGGSISATDADSGEVEKIYKEEIDQFLNLVLEPHPAEATGSDLHRSADAFDTAVDASDSDSNVSDIWDGLVLTQHFGTDPAGDDAPEADSDCTQESDGTTDNNFDAVGAVEEIQKLVANIGTAHVGELKHSSNVIDVASPVPYDCESDGANKGENEDEFDLVAYMRECIRAKRTRIKALKKNFGTAHVGKLKYSTNAINVEYPRTEVVVNADNNYVGYYFGNESDVEDYKEDESDVDCSENDGSDVDDSEDEVIVDTEINYVGYYFGTASDVDDSENFGSDLEDFENDESYVKDSDVESDIEGSENNESDIEVSENEESDVEDSEDEVIVDTEINYVGYYFGTASDVDDSENFGSDLEDFENDESYVKDSDVESDVAGSESNESDFDDSKNNESDIEGSENNESDIEGSENNESDIEVSENEESDVEDSEDEVIVDTEINYVGYYFGTESDVDDSENDGSNADDYEDDESDVDDSDDDKSDVVDKGEIEGEDKGENEDDLDLEAYMRECIRAKRARMKTLKKNCVNHGMKV